MLAAEIAGLVVGLLLGSFLNVCVVRVPRGESVVKPGSHCRACGRRLRWFDNVPVVSWLALRGRCRDCGAGISWRYPAVELAVGVWFARLGYYLGLAFFGPAPQPRASQFDFPATYVIFLLGSAVLGWLLIGLIVIDWEWQRLPDAFTLSGIAAGLFLVCTQAIFLGPTDDQVVLNGAKQLRLASPGSFAARGNVFLTGPEALIFGRLAAVCGGGADPAAGALGVQAGCGGREGAWAGRCEDAGHGGGVSGVLAGGADAICGSVAGERVRGRADGTGEGERGDAAAAGQLPRGWGAICGGVRRAGDRLVSGIALRRYLSFRPMNSFLDSGPAHF